MVCMKTDVHSEKDANETKSKCVRLISNFLAGLKPFLIFLHQTSPCPGDLGDDFSTLSSNLVGILRFFVRFEGYFENACQAYGQPAPPAPSMEAVD